jgi:catechol 2,3-dioxygenase-like lactoylglutathione lyase family enzyme
MIKRALVSSVAIATSLLSLGTTALVAQSGDLGVPGFHHLHLLSTDPEAAVTWYTQQFKSTSRTTWEGMPAVRSPTNVLVVFTKVDRPPLTSPQTAIWHFGWNVTDERASLADYQARHVSLAPLYTGDGDGSVYVSSDTWPGPPGSLGRTREQIQEAKAQNLKPAGGAGFGYLNAPDGVWIEFAGNSPAERFNHVHMFYDDPRCATLWYQEHLNVQPRQGRGGAPSEPITAANCKVTNDYTRSWPALTKDGMVRTATGGGVFDDVTVSGYVKQYPAPLVSTLGHTADHIGLSVRNLDAWIAKLRAEGVTFLKEPYRVGNTRAVMIEGPSKVALELVEVQ